MIGRFLLSVITFAFFYPLGSKIEYTFIEKISEVNYLPFLNGVIERFDIIMHRQYSHYV